MYNNIFMISQMIFGAIICICFISHMIDSKKSGGEIKISTKKEAEHLHDMNKISLNVPAYEKTRPKTFADIEGQDKGILALKAALYGENPQHIIIYGPPGIGKTAASRIALEGAKRSKGTPFAKNARFIEADATIMRFDERSIADPLIGSVHDPIYQGAGLYGSAGIPQIKEGAVSRAHGGILFIDEIGELHPSQMNKLLKVLEDRRVFFESAYYDESNENIPPYLHDAFKNGIPADFRLIGATTRSPQEIPPALRSRCSEIYFDPLSGETLKAIVLNASHRLNLNISEKSVDTISQYSSNGRDCVRILETCSSLAKLKGSICITENDVKWVIEAGRYVKKYDAEPNRKVRVGVVNAMAVAGTNGGVMMRIEVSAKRTSAEKGEIICTGIIESETMEGKGREYSRTSNAKSSVLAAVTAVSYTTLIDTSKYDIHVHFPGSIPVDGPSAGAAVFCAVCSAIKGIPIDPSCAVTGEISIKGDILPVGGVGAKIAAARKKGISKIFIPSANMCADYNADDITAVSEAAALLRRVLLNPNDSVNEKEA